MVAPSGEAPAGWRNAWRRSRKGRRLRSTEGLGIPHCQQLGVQACCRFDGRAHRNVFVSCAVGRAPLAPSGPLVASLRPVVRASAGARLNRRGISQRESSTMPDGPRGPALSGRATWKTMPLLASGLHDQCPTCIGSRRAGVLLRCVHLAALDHGAFDGVAFLVTLAVEAGGTAAAGAAVVPVPLLVEAFGDGVGDACVAGSGGSCGMCRPCQPGCGRAGCGAVRRRGGVRKPVGVPARTEDCRRSDRGSGRLREARIVHRRRDGFWW